jgi:Membrane bound beta barrel domain (DUF5777)
MRLYFLIALLVGAGHTFTLLAQESPDMLSLLGDEKTIDYVTAAFKSNRVVNGHSIENAAAGVIDMKISHRFAPVRNGVYDLFGLDGASIRIGLDYGINNRLMVGIGRNSREKIIDGFVKYKLLRQCRGLRKCPVTVAYLTDIQVKTVAFSEANRPNSFSQRLFYTHQLLIGRKWSERFSLQFMPTLVHRNIVATRQDQNDVWALGAAGRLKMTKRLALTAEYYYVPAGQIATPFHAPLSIGLDIETGGHVFQLHFSNTGDMTYKGFITETQEPWFGRNDAGLVFSGIRFGFNVSRVFTLRKPREF